MNKDKQIAALSDKVMGIFRGGGSRLWIVAAGLILVVVSFRSCVTIEPGEVAVRVNNVTGTIDTITRPGMIMRLPFGVHTVRILDASPQTFSMKGDANIDALHVKELTVRASDGSNFIFKDTTIIFRVLGDQAEHVIRDAGRAGGFRNWMLPFARAILREEFGRESTISVSNPATFGEATERAKMRINEVLAKHGLVVTSIVTPRPRFTEAYENLIEARNEAENQLTVIESELARAATERRRTLAEVDRDQNRIIQEKRATHEATLATAVSEQAGIKRETDAHKIEKVAIGQASLSAAIRRAEELQGELDAKYLARRAEIDAFRTQPVERVMERLGERLEGVTIDIQPFSDDATPSRVRMEQVSR